MKPFMRAKSGPSWAGRLRMGRGGGAGAAAPGSLVAAGPGVAQPTVKERVAGPLRGDGRAARPEDRYAARPDDGGPARTDGKGAAGFDPDGPVHEEPKAPAHPAVRAAAMLAALAGTVAFSVVLARLTLEPSPASVALTYSNVHPGQSIRAYLDHGTVREAARQLGGNLLLGVPFGVLLPVLVPQARGLARVAVCTTVVMTLVELVQGALVTGRAFDIDDVILNTAGALLGYLLLGRRLGRAVHPRRRHWWHRFTRRSPAG